MSKQVITAEDFWNKFAEKLREKVEKDPKWKDQYRSNRMWTSFIYELIGEDIKIVFKKTKAREYSTEYLRTDIGFYDINNNTPCIKPKYEGFEWDFDIAIEHENDESQWLDEFVKLVHINCGLKVLISYHCYSNKNGDICNEPKEVLETAEKIYNTRKYKNLNDNWLIILGPCFNDMEDGRDFVAYKSIINKDEGTIKFEKLENKQILHYK